MRSDSDQTMLLILTSLDQFMDVRLVFWRPLHILATSVMLCKCQILTKDGHSRFWPTYDILTSCGRPLDGTNVLERSDSDQTRTLWVDVLWMSWWHQWVVYFAKPDVPGTSLWSPNWRQTDIHRTDKNCSQNEVNATSYSDVILTKSWRPQNVLGTSDC